MCGFISGLFCLVDLCLFWCQYNAVLITIALQDSLKSGCLIPLALFIFLKIALTICSLLWSHMNFRIICSRTCSSPVENVMGILIGIALNLQIVLGSMAVLTIVILQIQEHELSFHFFKSY